MINFHGFDRGYVLVNTYGGVLHAYIYLYIRLT